LALRRLRRIKRAAVSANPKKRRAASAMRRFVITGVIVVEVVVVVDVFEPSLATILGSTAIVDE